MKEQLQAAHNPLLAAADEGRNLVGTEKTMPVNEPDDPPVAFPKPQGSSNGDASETGKSFLHRAILADAKQT